MRKRLIGVLAFALAVSAAASFVLCQLIASRMTVGASTKQATIKVPYFRPDLQPGALIQDRDIRTQEYLTPPPGALLKKEDIVNRAQPRRFTRTSRFTKRHSRRRGAACRIRGQQTRGHGRLPSMLTKWSAWRPELRCSPECASTFWFQEFHREPRTALGP